MENALDHASLIRDFSTSFNFLHVQARQPDEEAIEKKEDAMLKVFSDEGPSAKCFITHGVLPRYIDPQQQPTKKKPFSTIINHPCSYRVDLVLPAELYDVIATQIRDNIHECTYSKLNLPLSALLEGDFFTSYIRTGNITMLSEGRAGIDNLYFLKDGQLRLELPREIYERVGLVGHPIRDTGRKHLKTRYAIEINLRLPSMVHGKKGFERVVWAFKNVLNSSVTWLFYDFSTKLDSSISLRDLGTEPIDRHHPITKACQLTTKHLEVLAPPLVCHTWAEGSSKDAGDIDLGLLEWLDLVVLESPRILPGDRVDPFLCQYEVPDGGRARATKVTMLSWRGFMPAEWIKKLYLECFWAVQNQSIGWIGLSASAFKMEAIDGPEGYVLLTIPSRRIGDSEHGPAADDAGTPNTSAPMEYTLWELTSGHGRS